MMTGISRLTCGRSAVQRRKKIAPMNIVVPRPSRS